MVALRILMAALLLVFAAACTPAPKARETAGFAPRPDREVLYVTPFTTVMVPAEVSEAVFDRFVDQLNSGGEGLQYEFVILKGAKGKLPPEWLADQVYITGEIFGYVEDSGCCSTEILVTSRVRLYQPGFDLPTLTLEFPTETFFDHDYSTLEQERQKLAERVADELSTRLLEALNGG